MHDTDLVLREIEPELFGASSANPALIEIMRAHLRTPLADLVDTLASKRIVHGRRRAQSGGPFVAWVRRRAVPRASARAFFDALRALRPAVHRRQRPRSLLHAPSRPDFHRRIGAHRYARSLSRWDYARHAMRATRSGQRWLPAGISAALLSIYREP